MPNWKPCPLARPISKSNFAERREVVFVEDGFLEMVEGVKAVKQERSPCGLASSM